MPYVEYDEVVAQCSECGRMFPTEEALEEHRRSTHAEETPPPPARRASKPTTTHG